MDFKRLQQIIERAERVLVVTHRSPDEDAIGSTAAFISYLIDLGKDYRAYCETPLPERFDKLSWVQSLVSETATLVGFGADLVVILDLSDETRVGLDQLRGAIMPSAKIVVIDHHPGANLEASLAIVDSEVSSTAEILTNYFQRVGYKLSPAIADVLLIGVLGDTERFTNAATTPSAIATAADLLRAGAKADRISESERTSQIRDLKLFGLALARLRINDKYKVAVTFFKLEDLKNLGVEADAASQLSNYLKRLDKPCTIVVLKESDSNVVGVSLRSLTPDINVSLLARLLGGGGHVQAAGFRVKGRLDKTGEHWQVV